MITVHRGDELGRDAAIEFLDGIADTPGWDFGRYLRKHRPQVPPG